MVFPVSSVAARTSWIRAMLAEPLGGIVIELVQEARASA
jgi:hypothetical protein